MDPDTLDVDVRCSTCRAACAKTTTTATGALMLVDPDPHPNGNLRVEADLLGQRRCTVVAPGSEPVLYKPHWATCPDADFHRRAA